VPFCPECGESVKPGQGYCPGCGGKLPAQIARAASPAAAPTARQDRSESGRCELCKVPLSLWPSKSECVASQEIRNILANRFWPDYADPAWVAGREPYEEEQLV
jgi:predicted amidophosphoribosyltransferase